MHNDSNTTTNDIIITIINIIIIIIIINIYIIIIIIIIISSSIMIMIHSRAAPRYQTLCDRKGASVLGQRLPITIAITLTIMIYSILI